MTTILVFVCLYFHVFLTTTSSHHGVQALASISNKPKIRVTPVQSPRDLVELGNLRYTEWMLDLPEDKRPSRMAFRMATAETQQERMAHNNAVAFLARSNTERKKDKDNDNDDDDGVEVVVGTAELSCIELKDCYCPEASDCRYYYVTDLVTARTHRRQGVAATLMNALEQHALLPREDEPKQPQSATVLLLHVEHNNEAALGFYQALGYKIVDDNNNDELEGLDVDRLAKNAGVSGQLLLSKTLEAEPAVAAAATTAKKKQKRAARSGGGGKGFGR